MIQDMCNEAYDKGFAAGQAGVQAKLDIAIQALRQIRGGSVVEGHWLDKRGHEVDGEAGVVPDGCYDCRADTFPEGYDANGWCGADAAAPEQPLAPVYWELFDGEEQDGWIAYCADLAETALNVIGVPLKKE